MGRSDFVRRLSDKFFLKDYHGRKERRNDDYFWAKVERVSDCFKRDLGSEKNSSPFCGIFNLMLHTEKKFDC